MPRKPTLRPKQTKTQAQRLEDQLNLNRPDTPWYSDWYKRRGKLIEERAHFRVDDLTIARR
jgi:hypothetical protein